MRESIGRLLGVLLAVFIPMTCGFALYRLASEYQHAAFWQYHPGALMLYGAAPQTKFAQAYRLAATSARAKGFVFTDPQIVETNSLFNLWYTRYRSSPVIEVSEDGRFLLIDSLWTVQFADEDLECIMAHELGHAIDFQRQSEEHPVMVRLTCLDTQQRADSIGRLLCGERYDRILRRYVKRRPIVRRDCSVSDPVL